MKTTTVLFTYLALVLLVACKPSLESSSASVRIQAIAAPELTDLGVLIRIASNDPDARVRTAALNKIHDESSFLRVVHECSFADTRIAAVKMIKNEDVLAKLATEESTSASDDYRLTAVQLITHQPTLADLATRAPDVAIKCEAARRITDQTLLVRVAIQARETRPMLANNLRQISSPAPMSFGRIALLSPEKVLRLIAVKGLSDVSILERVAIHDPDNDVSNEALARISDQQALLRIALKTNKTDKLDLDSCAEFAIRTDNETAAENILKRLDELHSLKVVRNAKSDVRYSAVYRIKDQAVLKELATDSDPRIRVHAYICITDPSVLSALILKETVAINREMAEEALQCLQLTGIRDEAQLVEIATSSKSLRVRTRAIARISDEVTLSHFAEHKNLTGFTQREDDEFVRRAAVDALRNQERLLAFAREDEDYYVRKIALGKLNAETLEQLISKTSDADRFTEAFSFIKDQSLLAKIAGRESPKILSPFGGSFFSKNSSVVAVEYLTEQLLIEKIALEGHDIDARCAAVRKISNETILRQLTSQGAPREVRQEALERLKRLDEIKLDASIDASTDQAFLAKSASDVGTSASYRDRAAEKVTDEALLAKLAFEPLKLRDNVRLIATEKIKDPKILFQIVFDQDCDGLQRSAALMGFSHNEMLLTLSNADKDPIVRTTAILVCTDQAALQQMATNDRTARGRELAISGVTDEAFLLQRANEDKSRTVRAAAISALRTQAALLNAATQAYYQDVRAAARDRLADSDITAEIARADAELRSKLDASKTVDGSALAELAIRGSIDLICQSAVRQIENPEQLKRVLLEARDREVLKVALSKLSDATLLASIADATTAEPAVRLSAARKVGRATWPDIFRVAAGDSKTLGDALAAVTLFEAKQEEAKAGVENASLTLIRMGDEMRIPELIDLLEEYGEKALAEDYLNCGQPDLHTSASAWGKKRGYLIQAGNGSSRAIWKTGP